jgi:hypothetical protein
VQVIQQVFFAADVDSAGSQFALASFPSSSSSVAAAGGSGPKLPNGVRLFAGSAQDTPAVRSVFGASINFNTVFISDQTGAQNRPFTVSIDSPTGPIQLMNLGPAPDLSDVVHEMAHVWQSQHHSDPKAFMRNCLKCQGLAVVQNGAAASQSPKLLFHKAFPDNFPFSAYSFRRGNNFGNYGGEQIARQVELGEASIRAHISSVAAGAVDAANVSSLTNNTNTEDQRLSGVFG